VVEMAAQAVELKGFDGLEFAAQDLKDRLA
jgi:hypothetical protein